MLCEAPSKETLERKIEKEDFHGEWLDIKGVKLVIGVHINICVIIENHEFLEYPLTLNVLMSSAHN